jgi:hypothetical protein
VHIFRRQQNLIASVAAIAVLLASLMPTITQVFASRQVTDSFLSTICSTSVGKFVAFDLVQKKTGDSGQFDQKPGNKSMPMEHCPYCFTHAGSFGIMPSHDVVVVKLALSQPYPQLFYRSPYPLFAWLRANPRAPPVVS